jgi:hypothetical protein
MYDHLRDRVLEIQRLEVIANLDLTIFYNKFDNLGVCPFPQTSLARKLGYSEPVGTFSVNSFPTIDKYYDLYNDFKSDLLDFETIYRSGPQRIKEVLGINQNYSILFQKQPSTICFPPKSKELESAGDPEEQEPTKEGVGLPSEPTSNPEAKVTPRIVSPTKSTNVTEYYIDTNYLKLTFYEAITAVTSITISLIAVCNCIWVAVILLKNKNKKATVEMEPPFSDLELTPMLERKPKISFGTDEIQEFVQYGSTNTLPSPAPITKKRN